MTCALPVLAPADSITSGIDRALRQPLDVLEFRRFLVEHLDEHPADDFALLLRIRFAGQRREESLLGIDANDLDAHVLGKGRHDLIALAQAQQSVIDEYAGQLCADGLVQQRGHHRRIDAARQTQQHPVAADLRTNPRHAVLDDIAGGPARRAAGDLANEAPQDLAALQSVRDLGMKLQAVQAPRLVGHGGERRVVAGCDDLESRRHGDHPIAVAHPHIE